MLSGKILRHVCAGLRKMPEISTWPLVQRANIHSSYLMQAKIFVDRENMYAHAVLEQSLKPYKIFRLDAEKNVLNTTEGKTDLPDFVLSPEKDAPVDEVLQNFCALIQHCSSTGTSISDDRFNAFAELFCESCSRLSDAQLLEALRQIAQLQDQSEVSAVREPNFKQIWNTLDIECCHRLEQWDVDQQLLVCDAWYAVKLARICDFVWLSLRKLGRKVGRMRPEQLVHAMFFCNIMRRSIYEMMDFEVNLSRCVNEMSLQELGVMSMGFFKTQTPIRNPELIEQLYRRLMAELDTVPDITLVAILKVLRYSSRIPQVSLMKKLLQGQHDQLPRLSLMSCLHVALLGCDLQYCYEPIIESILQRFDKDIEQTRLKDLERICLVIGLFNFQTESRIEDQLCEKIMLRLHTKIDEIMRHPRCFPFCLHFLTLKGFYDKEMISSVLDKKFIRHAYGANMALGREIFHLDAFVKINLAHDEYTGNQLPEKMRRTMGKILTHYIPERNPKFKLNTTDRVLMEVKETTDRIFRCNQFKHTLPHFERPDVIVCYDREARKALPLAATCAEDYSGVILTRNELLGDMEAPHIDTLAIVVAGWNNVLREQEKFTGLFQMKLEQLKLLGHKYIVIRWHEWQEQETPADRKNYLKRKLATVINL